MQSKKILRIWNFVFNTVVWILEKRSGHLMVFMKPQTGFAVNCH